MRRPSAWFIGIAFASMAAGLGFACKHEKVDTVTVDLGVGNAGSIGFGCSEDRSTTCSALLECALKHPTQQAALMCLVAQCVDAGRGNSDCAAVVSCIRSDGGTVGDCYNAACETRPLLVTEGSDGDGGIDLHLIVDEIGLGGTPGCRGTELNAWCATHVCRPIKRTCVPIHFALGAGASAESIVSGVAKAWAAQRTLDTKAPDVPVVIRMIGTPRSGACTTDEEALDLPIVDPIVGCAYSCPTTLSSGNGDLTLDFDVLGVTCTEDEVNGCIAVFQGEAGIPEAGSP